jgi:DNA-binding NarL/FixJ family response regulator
MRLHRVLIIEDEAMFREFLAGWFRGEGFEVVAAVGTLSEGENWLCKETVDLVILDMDLPDGDGVGFVEREQLKRRDLRVLVVTAHTSSYPVMKLKRSGAMGVLDKACSSGAELRKAVDTLRCSRTYYSASVEATFADLVREGFSFPKVLSPREMELVMLFGRGWSNGRIAEELGLSEATVQGHRRNVMGKLNVHSTPDLMVWAIREGFVRGTELGRAQATG